MNPVILDAVRLRVAVAALALAVAATACAKFGYTDRILLRVASPDGRAIAVCQEVPEFDGPGFAVRLERPEGRIIRRLYEVGDGDGCSEITWSRDGRSLAVLTAHVARIRFVDVAWALAHPEVETAHWSWRQVSLSGEGQFVLGKGLRFTTPMQIELQLCGYSLDEVRRTGSLACNEPPVIRTVAIPQPIVTGHPGVTPAN
jgi:hypothetical protein